MSNFEDRMKGQAKQTIGNMQGDKSKMREGQAQENKANIKDKMSDMMGTMGDKLSDAAKKMK